MTAKHSKLYTPWFCWNVWRTADRVAWCSTLLKAVERGGTQCTSGMGHGLAPGGTYACHTGTWRQKTFTVTGINISKLMGDLTLEEKTHQRRTHGIIGISLRRHLGLMLLLQHNDKASTPPIVFLGISTGSKTTPCWPEAVIPMGVLATVAAIVIDDAPGHTTVIGGVVVLVILTWDIVKNTLQRKTSMIKFHLWLKIMSTENSDSQYFLGALASECFESLYTSFAMLRLQPDKCIILHPYNLQHLVGPMYRHFIDTQTCWQTHRCLKNVWMFPHAPLTYGHVDIPVDIEMYWQRYRHTDAQQTHKCPPACSTEWINI